MLKHITFLVAAFLFTLSVNCQTEDWSNNHDLEQASYILSDIEGNAGPFAKQSFVLKSDETATQQLDSVIYYSYDESNEEWNKKNLKFSIFYDKNFNDTLIQQSRWDESTDNWLTLVEEIKDYNENKQLLNREFYIISKSGNRTEYTYNDNDNLVQVAESFLDAGEWRYKTKNVYSYNSENVLQADTLYQRFTISGTPVWHKTEITTFYYNIEGDLMADTTLARYWIKEHSFGDWELFGNTVIDKMVSENTKETIIERWNSESNAFRPLKKEQTIFHNEDKDISAHINFEWNKELHEWDTTNMTSFSYGDDDFVIDYERCNWGDSPTKVLEVPNYDYTITNNELLRPAAASTATPGIAFHHKINSKQSFGSDISTNETQQFSEAKFYYSAVERDSQTSVDNTPDITLGLYPNPASEFIAINYPGSYHEAWLELFDVNGKKILRKAVNKSENINISNLKGGFYIYSIWVDEQKTTGKLLVE